jgi:hypothetical protein
MTDHRSFERCVRMTISSVARREFCIGEARICSRRSSDISAGIVRSWIPGRGGRI